MLQNPLCAAEEEEFVLENVAAHVAAKLVALERRLHSIHTGEAYVVILKVIESIPVERVGAGARGNEHLARRGHFTRYVLRGTVQLELVDRAFRQIEDCRAHRLVRNVLT